MESCKNITIRLPCIAGFLCRAIFKKIIFQRFLSVCPYTNQCLPDYMCADKLCEVLKVYSKWKIYSWYLNLFIQQLLKGHKITTFDFAIWWIYPTEVKPLGEPATILWNYGMSHGCNVYWEKIKWSIKSQNKRQYNVLYDIVQV